jgi:hypothetical protein
MGKWVSGTDKNRQKGKLYRAGDNSPGLFFLLHLLEHLLSMVGLKGGLKLMFPLHLKPAYSHDKVTALPYYSDT